MTAQYNQPEDQLATQPVDNQTDPIGPITLPSRGRIGARAMVLVGTMSVAAVGIVQFAADCGTVHTSISAPN